MTCGSAAQVTDHGLESLVAGCRRLRILNLTWCGGVSDNGVVAISRGAVAASGCSAAVLAAVLTIVVMVGVLVVRC